MIWRYILRDLGAKTLPRFNVLADVYAKAWMGRYIPGTITWIAGKIYLASKLGISKSRLAVSSLLEAGMQIAAAISVSLLILGFNSELDIFPSEIKILMILIAVMSIGVLYPPVLNHLLRTAYRLVRKKDAYDELHTNGKATARSYILYGLGTLITGSSYYFLTASLYSGTTPDLYWYIVGVFCLAGALGMITPLVPSGLGVRDGVQLVLLSILLPKEVALAVTVFSRLWSLAVDVLFYGTAVSARRIVSKYTQAT